MAEVLAGMVLYVFVLWLFCGYMDNWAPEEKKPHYSYRVKPWPTYNRNLRGPTPSYISEVKKEKQNREKPMRCFICNYCPDTYPNNTLDTSPMPATNHLIPYDKVKAICLNCYDTVDAATQEMISTQSERTKEETDRHPLTGERIDI